MSRSLTRKQFLASAAGAFGGMGAAFGQNQGKPPNILFAISDDQSWLHTSANGDRVVKTPNFDRVARDGVRFTHSFCCAPSCTPSRGSVLTGQHFWRLEKGGNLSGTIPKKFGVYPDMLEATGYFVGLMGKGWAPGDFKPGGYTRNPAGPTYRSFAEYVNARPKDKPFCFWFGSADPHRPYEKGSGAASGMKTADVAVPPWLPNSEEIRSDILDYYLAIQRFDHNLGDMLDAIEKTGELANTIVVVTSDNGMPFPRAKANLYDSGTRMPLAISWPATVPVARVVDDFVSHADFAPTFLEAAGLKVPAAMTGRSLLPLLRSKKSGRVEPGRDRVFTGRERHTQMRAGGVGYPSRALRTREFLYIRNFEPDRWPAGDPPDFGDIDNQANEYAPAKKVVIAGKDSLGVRKFYDLACAKRPAEELYDLNRDAGQQNNVAGDKRYKGAQARMSGKMKEYLTSTNDPRFTGAPIVWDTSPFYGGKNPRPGVK